MDCNISLSAYSAECGPERPSSLKKVFYDHETKKVYDELENFLGYGIIDIEDGILTITQEIETQ